ncbi:MAG TPA: oligopeptide:H+ symporter [Pseudonocardiaceae bacterium]|jgi:POT family proton-dependent oligopeptide transporter|nr:oligopeptide:H+ symporter [Pseudonocardiaceae bacterium]
MTTTEGAETAYGRAPWFVTLFMTDTWERFGFYALQAILVLYATASKPSGGLGLASGWAAGLFAIWIGLTFMLALPGGWIGDRLLGQRRTIMTGLGLIALGHFALAVPVSWFSAVGICLVALGTGLYKPNHQAVLNTMLGQQAGRRESGISVIFVGMQVSALLAPLIVGYVGERINWHLAFAIAGVALSVGFLIFVFARNRFFGDIGVAPGRPLADRERRRVGWIVLAVVVVLAALVLVHPPFPAVMGIFGLIAIVSPFVAYSQLRRHRDLTAFDRRKLRGFLWLLLGATTFWALITQDGTSLNLFARDHTDRSVFGFVLPASWLQSATPLFILVLAPVLAWLLPKIRSRTAIPVKLSVGLLMGGVSFLLMAGAAALAVQGVRVSPGWLLGTYLLHACGEVVVSAVAISAAADVLPRRFLGHTIGLFWLFAALGGSLGGTLVQVESVVPMPAYFLAFAIVPTVLCVVFAVRRKKIAEALSPQDDQPVPETVRPAAAELS